MSVAVLPKPKRVPSPKKQVALDPYYQTDSVMLFVGNCMQIMRELPESSVDMIFADPPYNLSNGGITCHAGQRVSVNKGDWDKSEGFDKDLHFHEAWISECRRVLKPTGTIWQFGL
jgi:site-specific DNA-methyltransferase (adenine-specific)